MTATAAELPAVPEATPPSGEDSTRWVRVQGMLAKELRGRMRGPRAFIVLSLYLAFLSGFTLLIYFLATRHVAVLAPVLVVIAGKLAIDMAFGVWALRRYRRWVGDPGRASLPAAAAALVIEPVTFTLLLHAGAVLGWAAFLGGEHRWGRQTRG